MNCGRRGTRASIRGSGEPVLCDLMFPHTCRCNPYLQTDSSHKHYFLFGEELLCLCCENMWDFNLDYYFIPVFINLNYISEKLAYSNVRRAH